MDPHLTSRACWPSVFDQYGPAGNQWRQAEKDGGAAPRYEEIVGIRCCPGRSEDGTGRVWIWARHGMGPAWDGPGMERARHGMGPAWDGPGMGWARVLLEGSRD